MTKNPDGVRPFTTIVSGREVTVWRRSDAWKDSVSEDSEEYLTMLRDAAESESE